MKILAVIAILNGEPTILSIEDLKTLNDFELFPMEQAAEPETTPTLLRVGEEILVINVVEGFEDEFEASRERLDEVLRAYFRAAADDSPRDSLTSGALRRAEIVIGDGSIHGGVMVRDET